MEQVETPIRILVVAEQRLSMEYQRKVGILVQTAPMVVVVQAVLVAVDMALVAVDMKLRQVMEALMGSTVETVGPDLQEDKANVQRQERLGNLMDNC